MSGRGDGVLIDDGSAAQQRLVGLHQDHRLPGVLSESGVELSSTSWHGVVVTDATAAGSGPNQIGLAVHVVVRVHSLDLEVGVLLEVLSALDSGRGLVRSVVEGGSDDLTVVLSQDGRWPGVDVVGVTAALAHEVALHVTAVGERDAEELLLWGQNDWALGDDSNGVAELVLGAVHGSRAGLGNDGEGFVLLASLVTRDDVGPGVGAIGDPWGNVVGSLEGGRVRTLSGLGWDVPRGGLRGNVTGRGSGGGLGRNVPWGCGRRRNVTRCGHCGLGHDGLVSAADVVVEAAGSLEGRMGLN